MPQSPANLRSSIPLTDDKRGPRYILEEKAKAALLMAWVTGRPLLVLGEAGTGKSQLAQAAANGLGVPLVKTCVQARTSAEDLFWAYDAVARLAEAQVQGASHAQSGDLAGLQDALSPDRFTQPGPLWWAWDWASAARHCREKLLKPTLVPQQRESAPKGCVLLIDEIDKAESDLPNSLLDVLETGHFTLPWSGEPIGCSRANTGDAARARRPLIVITSNGDRDLPPAFMRRCVVLKLDVPTGADFVPWLVRRGSAHVAKTQCDPKVLARVAIEVGKARTAAGPHQYRPGTSEFLDLVYALVGLAPGDAERQRTLLSEMAAFVIDKSQRLA